MILSPPPQPGIQSTGPGLRSKASRKSTILLLAVIAVLVLASVFVYHPFAARRATSSLPICVGSSPCILGMENLGPYHPATGVFEIEIAIYPTEGLPTGVFGLEVRNSTSGMVPSGIHPSSCVASSGGSFTAFTVANCGAPTGNWYAVLVFENTTIAAVFDSEGWSGAEVTVTTLMEIYVISGTSYYGIGDTLITWPTGSGSIAGTVSL
jgi:hypothetical protein